MGVKSLSKVLIPDAVDPVCVKLLQEKGIKVDYKPKLPLQDLLQEIKNYDGLIVRSATKVTKQVIEAAPNLRIIGRAGTGVDNIDTAAATTHGIIVMNTPGGNTLSAAEHTCAMMMAASRLIPQGYASLQTGKWERSQFMGHEVYGKTLAILGLGRIGREVATRMQSFGMKTIGYDPIIPPEVSKEFGVTGLSLEQIWPQADYITVHVPLLPETENLINDNVLSKCKKGVMIINVARGGVVDEAALLRSLEAGHCGGAALDVFAQEPPSDMKLVKHPKVVATPHLGANTTEAQSRVAQEIAEQFVDFADGKPPVGVVNAPLLSESLVPGRKTWMELAQSLGNLSYSLVFKDKSECKCEVSLTTYCKTLANSASLLSNAAAIGALHNKPNVNLINVKYLAEKHSMTVKGSYEDVPNRSQYLTVQVTGDKITRTCVGTINGDTTFLVSIDGQKFASPVVLNGNVELFELHGKPLSAAIEYFTKKGMQIEALHQTERTNTFNFLAVSFAQKLENPAKEHCTDLLDYITTL